MRKLIRDLNEKMEKFTGSSADLSAYKDVIDRFQKAIQSLVWITASRWSRMPGTDTKEDVKPIQDIIDQLYDMKDSIEDLMKMGPAVAEATGQLSNSAWKAMHNELGDMFSDDEAERVIGLYKRHAKDKAAFAKAAVSARIGTRDHGLVHEKDWLGIWQELGRIA